jgi:hypothetical protein
MDCSRANQVPHNDYQEATRRVTVLVEDEVNKTRDVDLCVTCYHEVKRNATIISVEPIGSYAMNTGEQSPYTHHLTKFILGDVRVFGIPFDLLERHYGKLVMKGWHYGAMGQALNEALTILQAQEASE